jgi:hypothetical protein
LTPIIGSALALLLLGALAFGLRAVYRVPFRALGILVAGMAFHNIVIMVLLRLRTPGLLIRAVQAWKEVVLLLLFVLALRIGIQAWQRRSLSKPTRMDVFMGLFAAAILIYFVLPSLLTASVSLTHRLVGARILLLIPALYFFGRVFFTNRREDILWVVTVIAGSAAVVGFLGLIELWFIPTRTWLNAGANLFSSWLGFTYQGPGGLPENFFHQAYKGVLVRRMVSTYLSPLGIAYTGLVLAPLAVSLILARKGIRSVPQWVPGVIMLFFLAGMIFSLSRLALIILIAEFFALALFWRRAWLFVSTGVLGVLVVALLFTYPFFGPAVNAKLEPIYQRPPGMHIFGTKEHSFTEHQDVLAYDLQFVIQHPLGTGLGSSVHRFGQSEGTGESAVLDVFGELGVPGGVLYLAVYALMLVYAARASLRVRRDPILAALPLVALVGGLMLLPVTITSDVWGDFSVSFLLWWAAGHSVSLASSPHT